MSPHLILIRGIPGSGKSTLAKTYTGYLHFENDQFLMEDGADGTPRYIWSEKRRKEAVRKCLASTRQELLLGNDVVVSNCFIKHKSMSPYIAIAKEAGARVTIEGCFGKYKSVHNVPEDVVESMKTAFEW